jgi:PKD repeat protein
MKKLTLFFGLMLFSLTTLVYAGSGQGPAAVSVIENGATAYLYKINTESWNGNPLATFNSNTQFSGKNFGTLTSLILDGGVAIGWADGGNNFLNDSFVIEYRVYLASGTATGWTSLPLDFPAAQNGNEQKWDANGKSIDILAMAASGSGTYRFEVRLLRKDYWNNNTESYVNTYGTQTATFTVLDNLPIASFDVFTVGLAGVPLNFRNTSRNATSYSWDFGDGTGESTDVDPEYTFADPGTYTVTLTADDNPLVTYTKIIEIVQGSTSPTEKVVNSNWFVAALGREAPDDYEWTDAVTFEISALSTNSKDYGMALYQPVYLEAGKEYNFECLVKDLDYARNTWIRVYISNTEQPGDLTNLEGEDNHEEIGILSTWTSGHSPTGINGEFSSLAIAGTGYSGDPCTFTPATSGMYYLMRDIGTWGYSADNNDKGDMDLAISNVSLSTANSTVNLQRILSDPVLVVGGKSSISAVFEGFASVSVFTIQGKSVIQTSAQDTWNIGGLSAGIYLVKINEKVYKVIVK